MAAPGYGDAADIEALIAYISNELIPQRVGELAAARPRRILTRGSGGSVAASSAARLTGWDAGAGDGGNGSGITYSDGVLTVAQSGIYEVEVRVYLGGTSSAYVDDTLHLNGSSSISFASGNRAAAEWMDLTIATRVSLSAGDELDVYLNSDVNASNIGACRWTIEKVA